MNRPIRLGRAPEAALPASALSSFLHLVLRRRERVLERHRIDLKVAVVVPCAPC